MDTKKKTVMILLVISVIVCMGITFMFWIFERNTPTPNSALPTQITGCLEGELHG